MFATVAELASTLQAEFTPAEATTAELMLANATGRIVGYTGQTISPAEQDTVAWWNAPPTRTLWVPRPLAIRVVVLDVEVDGQTIDDAEYRTDRYHGISRVDRGLWSGDITVTYEHGFPTVPHDVRDATLKLAVRMMTNPTNSQSVKIEAFSESFQTGSAASEEAILAGLDRYRTLGVA